MARADQGKSLVKTQHLCQMGSKQKAVLPQCCAQGHKPWWASPWSWGHISEGRCHTANDGVSHSWHLQRVYSVTWIIPMDNRDMNVESNSGGMESMQKKQTILFCQSLAGDTEKASKYIIYLRWKYLSREKTKRKWRCGNSPVKADELCDGAERDNMANAEEVSILLISECYSSLLLD